MLWLLVSYPQQMTVGALRSYSLLGLVGGLESGPHGVGTDMRSHPALRSRLVPAPALTTPISSLTSFL